MDKDNLRSVIFAVAVFFFIQFWFYFFPTIDKNQYAKNVQNVQNVEKVQNIRKNPFVDTKNVQLCNNKKNNVVKYIDIDTPKVQGKICTKGLLLSELKLLEYRKNVNIESEKLFLLKKDKYQEYTASLVNFASQDKSLIVPDENTIWECENGVISLSKPLKFSFKSPQGVIFTVEIGIDENYMFFISNKICNTSGQKVILKPYFQINNHVKNDDKDSSIVKNENFIGSIDKSILEYGQDKVSKKKINLFEKDVSWFGNNSKYWLCSFIPDKNYKYDINLSCIKDVEDIKKFISKISFSKEFELIKDQVCEFSNMLFVGPKQLSILDNYKKQYQINLFDKAVDFGYLYFITKPIFLILNFFYSLLKNYGLSIILLTVIMRIILFFISRKSDATIKKMKDIQPQINYIKEKYKNDHEKQRKEIINLYKKENVSFTGCLPVILQMPVFFAVYKVIDISLDLRHAPFFFWIKDLSAKDPISVLNLFGLLDMSLPSFLQIGLLPIFTSLSMYFQMSFTPASPDPVQAKTFKILPLMLIFLFANSSSGLLIYWIVSNVFSILQQIIRNKVSCQKLS